MQVNALGSNYQITNFSGNFYKKNVQETTSTKENSDNDIVPVHTAKKSSAKTRAVALAMAAMMALSLTACSNKQEAVEVANETATAMEQMDDLSMLFLSKITPEQMAQFTPEQLIELAKALRVYNINIGEIGDNSSVQINAQVIDGTFGDGVVLNWINDASDSENFVAGKGDVNPQDDIIQKGSYYMIKNGDNGYVPMTKEEAEAYLGHEITVNGKSVEESSDANTTASSESSKAEGTTTPAKDVPDTGDYWVSQAKVSGSVWKDLISKSSIVEATSKDNSLKGKSFELAAFIKSVGSTGSVEVPDDEAEAKIFTENNASALQRLYDAIEQDGTLKGFGLSGCSEDIKAFLDASNDGNHGDFKSDGDYSDDFKYLSDGTLNPDYKK